MKDLIKVFMTLGVIVVIAIVCVWCIIAGTGVVIGLSAREQNKEYRENGGKPLTEEYRKEFKDSPFNKDSERNEIGR